MIYFPLHSPEADLYLGSHPVLRRSLAWARALPADAPDGIVELDGPELYGNVHGYATRAAAACLWESHRRTVDLQICLGGGERIEWIANGDPGLAPAAPYLPEKDFEAWTFGGTPRGELRLRPGWFVLFAAGEPHRPMISDGENGAVRKVVVKIAARLLA